MKGKVKVMSFADRYKKYVADGKKLSMVSEFKSTWEVGETLIGVLLEIKDVHFEQNDSHVNAYVFETDDGIFQCILGAAVDNQAGEKMVLGNLYACTFKGKKDISQGRTLNLFDVFDLGKADTDGKTEESKKAH